MSSYTKSTYEASMGHYVSDEGRKKRRHLVNEVNLVPLRFFPKRKRPEQIHSAHGCDYTTLRMARILRQVTERLAVMPARVLCASTMTPPPA